MQPRNPWQMLAEPKGSAEPRLKITAVMGYIIIINHIIANFLQSVPVKEFRKLVSNLVKILTKV